MPLSQIRFSQKARTLSHLSRSFSWQWIVAHAIAGAIIGALEAGRFQFFATLILAGGIVGFAQWVLLRRWLHSRWWIFASAIGWIMGRQLSLITRPFYEGLIPALMQLGGWEVLWLNIITEPIVLLGLGIAQWILLRQSRSQVGLWIFASAIAGFASGAVAATTCFLFCEPLTLASRSAILATAIVYSAGWTAYSLVTLLPIIKIARRNR